MWFGSETGQASPPSGYGYPLQTCKISNISIGNGKLTDADASLFTSSQFSCPTLSSNLMTNQWVATTGNAMQTLDGAIGMTLVGTNLSTAEL